MALTSLRPKGRNDALWMLRVSIQTLDIAGDTCGVPPARDAFVSAHLLLTTIRATMGCDLDLAELGLTCADVCQLLYRTLKGQQLDELGLPALDAIENLTTTVIEIQQAVAQWGRRNQMKLASWDKLFPTSRPFRKGVEKDTIVAWRQDIVEVLQVFDAELAISPYLTVADIHENVLEEQKDASDKNHESTQTNVPLGESPPSPPRAFFGYDGLIEKVVELTETLKPTALIGTGGIGKTSIALTVLHHDRVKQRFGENRRFIRCDQFPPSRPNFLAQLSKAIGAGVGNPEDMKLLRPFLLSSKRMLIVLDNAESILDPQGTNAQEIYSVVDELCRFRTVCLFITSRITTLPRRCVRLKIFALSMKAACDIFYSIYHGSIGRSGIINGLLRRMDRHPLSVTLLATAAACNAWDYDQLTKEWDTQWARVSEIGCNKCLATTIELTLASPKFCSLGPNARDLLGVVAFFPQGINKTNIDRFFPTISNRIDIFATLCVLSLVYQSNGFFTMLAPIRDYLYPQDPQSSPLLCAVRDNYFSRLSVSGDPDQPGFKEARWVVSESANVEHLLDVSTSVNQNGGDIWDACYHFLRHLYWHKPWQIPLRSKIEALPDDHPSKPKCLSGLSQLFGRVGNHAEQIRVLTHALELERRSGNDHRVAQTLQHISDVNRLLGLSEEGIEQANESLEILERIGDTKGQTQCLNQLAWLLFDNKQLDAAENAASRAMDLTVGNGQEYLVCQLHQVLCKIHNSKGREKEVVHHLEAALNIASPPKWRDELFWICYSLAEWSGNEEKLDAANKCIKRAKSHAVDDPYRQGRAMVMQANIWCLQLRLEDAKSETLRALEIYKKSGAAYDAGVCRDLLQMIERAMEIHPMGFQGELPEAMLYPADFYFLPRNTPGFSTPVMITQGAVHGPGGYPIPEYYDPHPFF